MRRFYGAFVVNVMGIKGEIIDEKVCGFGMEDGLVLFKRVVK